MLPRGLCIQMTNLQSYNLSMKTWLLNLQPHGHHHLWPYARGNEDG